MSTTVLQPSAMPWSLFWFVSIVSSAFAGFYQTAGKLVSFSQSPYTFSTLFFPSPNSPGAFGGLGPSADGSAAAFQRC